MPKFVIEVDLDYPLHQEARGVFMAVDAVLKTMRQQIPPTGLLGKLLEKYPDESELILAEGVCDEAHETLDSAVSKPANIRMMLQREPFDTDIRAKQQVERTEGSKLGMTAAGPMRTGPIKASDLSISKPR